MSFFLLVISFFRVLRPKKSSFEIDDGWNIFPKVLQFKSEVENILSSIGEISDTRKDPIIFACFFKCVVFIDREVL